MRSLGDLEFITLPRGTIRVDGGALFGIVPYNLWSKIFPPHPDNTIAISLTSLLVKMPSCTVLVDPAGASLLPPSYFYQETDLLENQLSAQGITVESVDYVILSHLHTDHVEGLFSKSGKILFPKAKIILQRSELEEARFPSLRTEGDYPLHLLDILSHSPQLAMVSGTRELRPGLKVAPAPGHTRGHQIVYFSGNQGRLIFLGDLVPTTAHLRLPYISSFDLYPKTSLDFKEKILPQITEQDLVVFFHDPEVDVARIKMEGENWKVEKWKD